MLFERRLLGRWVSRLDMLLDLVNSSDLGPVLLDFPIDMLFSPVQEKLISWGSITSPPTYPPGPSADAVDEAVSLIRSAERPVIVIGSGVRTQQVSHPVI